MPSISGFTWSNVTQPTGSGVVLEVGVGKQYATVQEAYNASSEGDTILVHEGTYTFQGSEYHPVGGIGNPVLVTHSVQIIGVGNVVFDASAGVAKGALVTANDPNLHLYVENITFTGASNGNRNGAGIRHQDGTLTVVDSRFEGNQNGILADSNSVLVHVDNSEFIGNGTDGFSHGIYAHGAELIVENSFFSGNIHGHHIKSVAIDRTIVYNNNVEDAQGSASYHVDVTGGGDLLVYGNNFEKGEFADNRRFVYYDSYRNGGEPGTVIVENNVFDAGAHPLPDLLIAVYNETTSIIDFVNNTVTGLLEENLLVGLGNVQGGTLDGAPITTELFDDGATELTTGDDVAVISGSATPVPYKGLEGNDAIIGGSQSDTLFGNSGNDLLVGNDGADKLLGNEGADTIFGGSGKDVIDAGAGDDLVDVGTGSDLALGGDGNDTLVAGDGGVLIGGDGNDVIIGGVSGEVLLGSNGDDTIYGGNSADTFYGGEGNDILVYRGTLNPNLSTDATEEGWLDTAFNSGYDFAIAYAAWWSSELVIWGISEDGMSEAGNGLNYYQGNPFFDDKESFNGIEKIQFDNGVYDVVSGVFTAGLQLVDIDTIISGLPSNPSNSEEVTGTEGDDTFLVDAFDGFATFNGLGGYDRVLATADNMTIRLSGFSTTSAEEISANGYINVDISGSGDDDVLDFSNATLVGITAISGGFGNDQITGSASADTIRGGFGADTLTGGDGDDVFVVGIGEGPDLFDGGAGSDTISILSGANHLGLLNTTFNNSHAETISLQSAGTLSISAESGVIDWNLSGISFVNATALDVQLSGWDDSYIGSNLGDAVSGDGGNDTISGGAGNDTLSGGSGNDSLQGNDGNDVINGGINDDVLDGGDGDDVFQIGVGHGHDRIYGGAGHDVILATTDNVAIGLVRNGSHQAISGVEVIDAGGHSGVTIVGGDSNNFAYRDNLDFSSVTLVGIERIDLKGGNDTFVGSAGNDIIVGGVGADVLDGGDGNDIFEIGLGHGHDRINGGAGNDTVLATADNVAIGFERNGSDNGGQGVINVEVIDAGGHSGVIIVGSDSDNFSYRDFLDFTNVTLVGIDHIDLGGGSDTFIGSTGNDAIIGGTGNDNITAGAGDDTINGGEHNDVLTGSGGADSFVFSGTFGTDTVTDFELGADVIDLSGSGLQFSDLTITQNGADTLIDGGSGNTITLQGIQATDITESHFVFYVAPSVVLTGTANGDTLNGDTNNDTLDGVGGDDTISGLAGSDSLLGGDGNDIVSGGSGNDTLNGGAGADTLIGGLGNDSVIGGVGNDVFKVENGFGSDTIMDFVPGTDIIDFSATSTKFTDLTITQNDADTHIADGNGNTLILQNVSASNVAESDFLFYVAPPISTVGTSGNDSIVGDENNDTLSGAQGDDTISGEEGADLLNGDDGHDKLFGGGGTDTIDGGNGNDTIEGGTGNDILTGGNDADIFVQNGNFGADIITDFAPGVDTLDLSASVARFSDLTITQNGADTLIDTGNGNTILLEGILASAISESDFLFSVSTLTGTSASELINGSETSEEISGLGGHDTLNGNQGNDTISGDTGNDVIDGGDGDDVFLVNGGDGHDRINGGAGSDTVLAAADNVAIGFTRNGSDNEGQGVINVEFISAGGHSGVTIVGGDSNNFAYRDYLDFSNVTLVGIERIDLGGGADTLIGSAGNDVIEGGTGNDVLEGGAGNDTFEVGVGDGHDHFVGGEGSDTILATANNVQIGLFSHSQFTERSGVSGVEVIDAGGHSGVTILGNDSTNFSYLDILDFTNVSLVGIERIELQGGNDTLVGSSANDVIDGGAGNDVLDGGDGNDIFEVGIGDGQDVVTGGTGSDTVVATEDNTVIGFSSFAAGAVEAVSAGGHANVTVVGGDMDFSQTNLIGIASIKGGINWDLIVGSSAADTIIASGGWDTLKGGDGDDTFLVGSDVNHVLFEGGNGTDTILVTEDNVSLGIRNGFTAGAVETIDANGHTGFSIINNLGDSLVMDFSQTNLIGVESIRGGNGHDTITGNSGNDMLLGGPGGSDVINGGAGNDTLDGGNGNDQLHGGDGDDTFLIGLSSYDEDRFYGEAGNDRILVTADNAIIGIRTFVAGDVETIDAGGHAGVTIQGTNSYSDNIDLSGTTLVGISQIDLRGGSDTLIASSGNDVIFGGTGHDNITAGAGDDTIYGGEHNDVLTGGSGADSFVFSGTFGTDTVTDFELGVDVLDLSGTNLQFADLTITQSGVDALVDTGNGNTILLQGIQVANLTENDFVFPASILTGTNASELINGTDASDEISGLGGNDTLNGNQGDDTISGGAGNDVLDGGDGNDIFEVGIGDGQDVVTGGTGSDTVVATEDNTVIGFSSFAAGAVEAVSAGGHANVTVVGGDMDFSQTNLIGIASIKGGINWDLIVGSSAADTIIASGGWDTLKGGDGDDTFLVGSDVNHVLFEGGNGTDTILVTEDNVSLGIRNGFTAGAVETIDANGHTGFSIINNLGDSLVMDFSQTNLIGVESIRGGNGHDTITGNSGNDMLLGGPGGSDVINGGAGNDTLDGGNGNDQLHGGDGDDTFLIGLSSYDEDRFYGEAGNDRILVTADNAIIGIRTFVAGDVETIDAGGHAGVTIQGTNSYSDNIDLSGTTLVGISQIDLRGGSDTLIASSGNDVIFGGTGHDNITAGAGDDTIYGGEHNDVLTGGSGADSFVFSGTFGTDTVTDFELGVDVLDLSGTNLQFADLTITQSGVDALVDTGNGNTILLQGIQVASITESNFVF